jgi:dipeptidyl aminopeptidase/acylaminoacyl peptidase
VLDFPRWSPDGKLIAFSRHDPTEGYCGCAGLPQHLEVVSADGVSAPRRVIPKDGEAIDSLQWFPDGQVLAYGFGGNGNYQSGRVNLDGKGNMDLYHAQDAQETFLSTYLDPAVAPDGQHVASATGAQTGKPGIFVSASDGSDGTQLIDLGQQDGFGLTVAWTPDGSGVVYATGAAVSVVPLDGGPSTDLVDVPGHVDSDVAPVISGDGSTVAFLYTSNDPPRYDVAWNLGMSRLADAQLATIGGAFPGTRLQWVGGKAGVLYVARTSYNEPATLRFGSLSTDSATDVVGISDRANNAFDWHQ